MTKKWFQIGLVSVFLLSLALRFWGLGRFNTLVFDEVYYAKFGNNYLTGVRFFDGHPPLGKLIIAAGIWLGKYVPWWNPEVNGLTGSLLSPLSYRWFNAFFGSFIPLLVSGIAYQLSHRRSFSLIAGLFAACDGIFLVEARYALINQYIVIFGLLGQFCLLLALNHRDKRRNLYLAIAGVGFGASIGTKWNGVFYLAGAYGLWMIAWMVQALQHKLETYESHYYQKQSISSHYYEKQSISVYISSGNQIGLMGKIKKGYTKQIEAKTSPLANFTQLSIFQVLTFLAIIPFIIYSLIWIPHLRLDTRYDFVKVHQQILGFHERMGGNSPKVHPYCAAWYKWPLMTRPMAYYYQSAQTIKDPLPVTGPPLPAGTGKVFYDVHAMGNPFLWWLSVAALAVLVGILLWQLIIPSLQQKRLLMPQKLTNDTWIALYLVFNYAINLLPWVKVTRCVFIYHYMTGVVFGFMAIAFLVDHCIRSYRLSLRAVGVTLTFVIIGAFIFWLPIYLGLPLTPTEYKWRMWFSSWI
jgi:dolichyl-phosphate-mannose-protein mannosyltransferase